MSAKQVAGGVWKFKKGRWAKVDGDYVTFGNVDGKYESVGEVQGDLGRVGMIYGSMEVFAQ